MEFIDFIRTPQVEKVKLFQSHVAPVEGTLCVGGHHLILTSPSDQKEHLWLLHKNVDAVEKNFKQSSGSLVIRCKDFTIIQLEIPSYEDCVNIASSIEQLSNIENINLQYPFYYNFNLEIIEDGWTAFTPEMEFVCRVQAHSEDWRVSYVNNEFQVCGTYAKAVIVPKVIEDELLIASAKFREGGRFPVLSYLHKDNGTAIMRCGQPLVGPNNTRCREDEKLLNCILAAGTRGYVIDTRQEAKAKGLALKGGGVEPDGHYGLWRRIHHAVETGPVTHESLVKLVEGCIDINSTVDKWLSRLEASGWLAHLRDILTCACMVAQCIDKEGQSVLVHGTEGMDSTLQVTSLAQLILDPDCRTIRGFEALVEREWLQAGHPFAHRNAKSAFATSKNHREAPTFLLFLDCVWQIWQQFPLSFEFNEDFLIMLFKHSYCSQFGTFLCNSEYERNAYKLHTKTVSLWSHVNRPEILETYMNPLYDPNQAVIWPSVAPQSLILWNALFMPWQEHSPITKDMWEEMAEVKQADKAARSKVIRLRKQLAKLEKEAMDCGLIPTSTVNPT